MMEERDKRRIRFSNRWLYALVAPYVVTFAMFILVIQYVNYVDNRSNRMWCDIITVSDDAYQKEPPKTPTGKLVAKGLHRLRAEFEC